MSHQLISVTPGTRLSDFVVQPLLCGDRGDAFWSRRMRRGLVARQAPALHSMAKHALKGLLQSV